MVVTGNPDNLPRSQAAARFRERSILASQMHAVGADRNGQIEMIVDDEGYLKILAKTGKGMGLMPGASRCRLPCCGIGPG